MHKPVRLSAKDRESLSIISGLVQDSLLLPLDMQYSKKDNHFISVLNRFVWERQIQKPPYIRTHTILYFKSVLHVHSKNINSQTGTLYTLLSLICTSKGDALHIYLSLAGDSIIRLTVATIDVTIKDVGKPWQTNNLPSHDNRKLTTSENLIK